MTARPLSRQITKALGALSLVFALGLPAAGAPVDFEYTGFDELRARDAAPQEEWAAGPVELAMNDTEESAPRWLTDFKAAQKKAKSSNKPVLMNFTGSDWCRFCVLMHENVFSKQEFKDFAKDELVLFEADYPQGRAQAKSLKAQNAALASFYSVQAYPTFILLDSEGDVMGRIEGKKDPESFAQAVRDLKASHAASREPAADTRERLQTSYKLSQAVREAMEQDAKADRPRFTPSANRGTMGKLDALDLRITSTWSSIPKSGTPSSSVQEESRAIRSDLLEVLVDLSAGQT